jgi:hypothetical protein
MCNIVTFFFPVSFLAWNLRQMSPLFPPCAIWEASFSWRLTRRWRVWIA